MSKKALDALMRLTKCLKKVDPKTGLPGNLLNKSTLSPKSLGHPEVQPPKMSFHGNPDKAKLSKFLKKCNNLKKAKMYKDDQKHAPYTPEERAHAVVEQGVSIKDAIKDIKTKKDEDKFVSHIKTLGDKKNLRSKENVTVKNK